MVQVRLENAAFGYADLLFSDVDITIADNDRLGIVGNNGSGKSTLLQCIAGQLELTEGKITYPKGLRVGMVEQTVPKHLEGKSLYEAIAQALPKDERDMNIWKVDIALDTFKAPKEIIGLPIEKLSGGWQRLALIARAWLSEPDILLLDEPTNHLDLEKIFVLEKWINEQIYGVPLICVSHDRRFLDNCTTKTLFVRPVKSASYNYSFSRAQELLFEDDKTAFAQREKELKEIDRLEKNAHELRQTGINDHSDLALKKAKYLLKRAEVIKSQMTQVHVEKTRSIKLTNSGTHAKRVLGLKNVKVQTPDNRDLFTVEKLDIKQGDRIVIMGTNGSGKTQLLNMLRRAFNDLHMAKEHGIYVGPSIKLGYLDQQLSQLPAKKGIRDFISGHGEMTQQRAISRLVEAGFPYDKQEKKIDTLSFGEKSRLCLLSLRLEEPNFYIMDEPTNHLDIDGQKQIEQEIFDHDASCILVSHDRSFVANLGTRFFAIDNMKLREIDGPDVFYDYLLGGKPMFPSNPKKNTRGVMPEPK